MLLKLWTISSSIPWKIAVAIAAGAFWRFWEIDALGVFDDECLDVFARVVPN